MNLNLGFLSRDNDLAIRNRGFFLRRTQVTAKPWSSCPAGNEPKGGRLVEGPRQ